MNNILNKRFLKVEITKYYPNFVEIDPESEILEFECDNREWLWGKGTNVKGYIMEHIWYLKDKIGKVKFKHNGFTQTLVIYEDKPYAWINILEYRKNNLERI